MNTAEKETREFLEGLQPAELRRLLDTPAFSGQVLEAAAESEQVSHTVDGVLDAEFQEMTPEQQERINRLASKIRERFARPQTGAEENPQESWIARRWRLIRAGTRQFGGAEPALVMGAHQKSEPGWPFELETGQPQLRFDLFGVDLVVSNLSSTDGRTVLIEVKESGKKISLRPGHKESLGDIDDFHLNDTSDKDAIAQP